MADDDTYTTPPSYGGVPLNYASPQAIQQAYLRMMQQKRGNQTLAAYRHPLAAVGDIAETFANQMQLRRLMGGLQQQNAASTTTVPGLPGGDSSGGGAPPMSAPAMSSAAPAATPPMSAPPAMALQSPSTQREAAAVNSGQWQPDPDFGKSLATAQNVINSGPPPPGGASMGGQPGASYSQIMPGAAGGAAPAPAASPSPAAQPSAGAPPQQFMAPDPKQIAQFQIDQQRVQQLKKFYPGSPEHQEGIRLEEDLQKRLNAVEKIPDPRTGEIQYYNPLKGGWKSGIPRQLTPQEEASAKELGTKYPGMRGGPEQPAGTPAAAPDAATQDMSTYIKNTPETFPRYPGDIAGPGAIAKYGSQVKEYEGGSESFRNEYKRISSESLDARDSKSQLQLLERVLQNPAVQSGFAHGQIATWSDAARVAGLGKGETATWNAIADKLGSRQQVSDIRETNIGQGVAVRATEASAIKASQFSLDRPPEANLAVARLQLRAMDRIIDNGKFANEYAKQHGRLDNGYYQARDDWFAAHPFMSDEELANYHDLTKGAPSPKPGAGGRTPGMPEPPAPAAPTMTNPTPQQAASMFGGGAMPSPSQPPTGPAPVGSSVMDILRRGPPGPDITSRARTSIGLPAAVPPMPPMSAYTSDVTAKARQHPEGVLYALGAGGLGAGVGAAANALRAGSPVARFLLDHGVGTGGAVLGADAIWRYLTGGH